MVSFFDVTNRLVVENLCVVLLILVLLIGIYLTSISKNLVMLKTMQMKKRPPRRQIGSKSLRYGRLFLIAVEIISILWFLRWLR